MITQSCGLKITTEIDDNVLLGTWKLTRLRCFRPVISTSFLEDYIISSYPTQVQATLVFEGGDIQYTVAGDCTTSATGTYTADFNGTGKGKVDIIKVLSATACSLNLPFSGNGGTGGNGDVKFSLLSTYSSDLDWSISEDRNTLELDFFTDFKGSTGVVNFCEGDCNCIGTWDRS